MLTVNLAASSTYWTHQIDVSTITRYTLKLIIKQTSVETVMSGVHTSMITYLSINPIITILTPLTLDVMTSDPELMGSKS